MNPIGYSGNTAQPCNAVWYVLDLYDYARYGEATYIVDSEVYSPVAAFRIVCELEPI